MTLRGKKIKMQINPGDRVRWRYSLQRNGVSKPFVREGIVRAWIPEGRTFVLFPNGTNRSLQSFLHLFDYRMKFGVYAKTEDRYLVEVGVGVGKNSFFYAPFKSMVELVKRG